MSRDRCLNCGKVVSTTTDENLGWFIMRNKLEEIDCNAGQKKFSDVIFQELKQAHIGICICQQCFDQLKEGEPFEGDAIHGWFELSYAQYLTVPRSVLQSMPAEWQTKFVQLLEALDDMIDWRPKQGQYRCQLFTTKEVYDKGERQFVEHWDQEIDDPLMDYQRGRRKIPHIE